MLANRYEVSNLGRFRRRNKCWPRQRPRVSQYRYVIGTLSWAGYRRVRMNYKHRSLARIVLEAFVGPCPEGHECDHKNRERDDDRLVNLRWVTHSENMLNRRKYKHKKNR